MRLSFPYGKEFLDLDIADERVRGILLSKIHDYKPKKDPDHTAWLVKMDDFHFTRNGTGSGSSTGSSSGSSAAPAQERQQSEPRQQTLDDIPDSFEEAEDDIPF